MSEAHLRQRLVLELGSPRERPFGGRLPVSGIGLGLGLVWGLCMSRIQDLRSRYIHSFSIIGGPWL